MKHKVSELQGALLDAAVALANGSLLRSPGGIPMTEAGSVYAPSTNWTQGGPIIERERINITHNHDDVGEYAEQRFSGSVRAAFGTKPAHHGYGKTPLIAAMRAYVAKKFGDSVDLP